MKQLLLRVLTRLLLIFLAYTHAAASSAEYHAQPATITRILNSHPTHRMYLHRVPQVHLPLLQLHGTSITG